MPLARIQASIVRNLFNMGQLSEAQLQTIISAEEDISGVALENLLFDEYKISSFQVLMAKAQAFKLPPINVKNCLINELTFAQLDQDFCRENLVLPLGTVGDFIVIAVSDPFDLNKVNEVRKITKMRVSVLLGLESAVKNVLGSSESVRKGEGFEDVVEALVVIISLLQLRPRVPLPRRQMCDAGEAERQFIPADIHLLFRAGEG